MCVLIANPIHISYLTATGQENPVIVTWVTKFSGKALLLKQVYKCISSAENRFNSPEQSACTDTQGSDIFCIWLEI